jgi:3-phenylpropionate/cinnamic acid dioxygenase small subunit
VLTIDDEREIAALIVRYGTGIDTRDWKLFQACFTDDFHGDYGAFGTWSSSGEITAAMEKMHEHVGPTLHRMTNIVVRSAEGGARVRTYVDAILSAENPSEPAHQGIGYYDDVLLKTGEGWKIKSRRFTPVRLT